MKNKYIILILILFLVAILLFSLYFSNLEHYSNNIDVYVISLKTPDRLENIKKQTEKMKKNIEIFDATRGDKLDIDDLIRKGILSEKYKDGDVKVKREIGCYMSHKLLYNKIKEMGNPGYTIILEDDFVVKIENIMDEINSSIDKLKSKRIDFDLLFLGNLNNIHGEPIIDNIYYDDINTPLLCTHAYMVNNNSIDKIINETKLIDEPIDWKLNNLSKNNKLKMLVLYPTLVDQGGAGTIINDKSIELLTNYSNH